MSCNNGFRTRNLTCINGQICSIKTKPHLNESCFHSSCFSTHIPFYSTTSGKIDDSIYADILLNTSNSSILDKALENITKKKSVVTTMAPVDSINNLFVKVIIPTNETKFLFKNKETDDYDENIDEAGDSKMNLILKRKSKQFSTPNSTKKSATKFTKSTKRVTKLKVLKKKLIKHKKASPKSLRSLNYDTINADVIITVPHTSNFFLNSTIIQSLNSQEYLISTTIPTTTISKVLDQMDYFFGNDMDILSKELDDYEWYLGGFTNCSRGCGNGFRSRTVKCKLISTGDIVDDFNCLESKPIAFEACNTSPCLDWNVTDWSDVK